ncbi:MAG: response regulator [Candidatus Paceibacterota bacterium]
MKTTSKKILIIEDEKPLARALELKLIHEGFEVKSLPNGEGLLSLLGNDKFSLVVCDLVMPKVDGFQILQIFKEENINIPVIILTNLGQAEDEKRVRALGAKEFFIKSDTPLSKIVSYIKENTL